MDKDLIYKLALTQVNGIGAVNAKSLIGYCGGVSNIFNRPKSFLEKVPGVGSYLANQIKSFKDFSRVEKEVLFIEKHGIECIFFLDAEYPVRLKNIPDSPILLFVRGTADLSPEKCIGIVGTRKMTNYGKQFVTQLTQDLKEYNATVISGLAYGVDVWSHKECIKNKIQTFGVVAHGLDRIYPREHTQVARQMIDEGGAVITEYLSETEPHYAHFPCRNRIVAGLVDALIVVESAERGGSLITAELANQYNRDVLAVPGGLKSKFSAGCNYLIKNHKAHLFEGIDDLVKMLNWDVKKPADQQRKLFIELTENEKKLMSLISANNDIGVDDLFQKSNFTSSVLAMTLLELEMKNCISSLPGKRYQLI